MIQLSKTHSKTENRLPEDLIGSFNSQLFWLECTMIQMKCPVWIIIARPRKPSP